MNGTKCLQLIPYLWLQRYLNSSLPVVNCQVLTVNQVLQSSKLSTISPRETFSISIITGNSMDAIKEVEIDGRGKFKYIQITMKDDSGNEKLIVRGYKDCGYHADILERVQLQYSKFHCDSPGGGRISHDPDSKKILVYGYSMGFGRADHEKTVEILKEAYPDYTIEWSNEGY